MSDATYMLMREAGVGMIALMLIVLTLTLVRYLYRHWKEIDATDREARNIALGLTLFFGSVAFRSAEVWAMLIMTRYGMPIPGVIASTIQSYGFYLFILGATVVGAICTVRSFNPGPIWTILIMLCVIVPVIIVFL